MPPVGSTADGDVSVPEHGFRVRIPGYRREAPLSHEVANSDATVFSFSRQGDNGNSLRYLKIIVFRFPAPITSAHVRDTCDRNLRQSQAIETEPLTESNGQYRSTFTLPRGFDHVSGEYICQQRMIIGKNSRILYILMAASPAGERFNSSTESEFNTLFRSFTMM
jgi:hypothetical protein